jgi:two-component system response regulator NreC
VQKTKTATIVVAMGNHFMGDIVYWILLVQGTNKVKLATRGADALALIADSKPEVVILDSELIAPDSNQIIQQLLKNNTLTKCIVYVHDHNHYNTYMPYLLSGKIFGVLCQKCGLFELLQCLEEVKHHNFYLTPHLNAHLRRMNQLSNKIAGLEVITKREREVLNFLAEGFTNEQIAERLCISYRTVVNHKQHVVEKLALKGSHELLPFALSMRHQLR